MKLNKDIFKNKKAIIIAVCVILALVLLLVGFFVIRKNSYKVIENLSEEKVVDYKAYSVVKVKNKYYICFADLFNEIKVKDVDIDGKNVTVTVEVGSTDLKNGIPYDNSCVRVNFEPENITFKYDGGSEVKYRKVSSDLIDIESLNIK